MNVVFIGSSAFGLRCLAEISMLNQITVTGVVTAPRQFEISYSHEKVENYLHADFLSFCRENTLPCEVIGDKAMKDEELLASRGLAA